MTFSYKTAVNVCTTYETNKDLPISSYPTLENCLFKAVTLTKNNNDIDECKYSEYSTGPDIKGNFSKGNVFGRNCIIFGINMSSSAHVYKENFWWRSYTRIEW